jgi:hypothetical protein
MLPFESQKNKCLKIFHYALVRIFLCLHITGFKRNTNHYIYICHFFADVFRLTRRNEL